MYDKKNLLVIWAREKRLSVEAHGVHNKLMNSPKLSKVEQIRLENTWYKAAQKFAERRLAEAEERIKNQMKAVLQSETASRSVILDPPVPTERVITGKPISQAKLLRRVYLMRKSGESI